MKQVETNSPRPSHLSVASADQNPPKLLWAGHGPLYLLRGHERIEVFVKALFPWTDASAHWALLNSEGEEVLCLNNVDEEMDEASAQMLKAYVAQKNHSFEILAIEDIVEEVSLRRWVVQTAQGQRIFHSKLDEWPHRLGPVEKGSYLIRSLEKDVFEIKDVKTLDQESQKKFWPFSDH